MTKAKNIAKLIVAIGAMIASLSILAAIIYFLVDLKRNMELDLIIDDYTITFMLSAMVFFFGIAIIFLYLFLKFTCYIVCIQDSNFLSHGF